MGLVEEIENLRPELHVDLLGCLEILIRGKIEIVKARPCEGVSSQVPVGSSRRRCKGTRIEPQVWSSQLLSRRYAGATCCNSRRGIVAKAGIQVRAVRKPSVPISGTVIPHAPRKRFPCTEGADSINRPAAQNCAQGFLLEAEWDGIRDRGDKIVSRVEGGAPPVPARVQEIHDRVGFLARFAAGES